MQIFLSKNINSSQTNILALGHGTVLLRLSPQLGCSLSSVSRVAFTVFVLWALSQLTPPHTLSHRHPTKVVTENASEPVTDFTTPLRQSLVFSSFQHLVT